MVLCLLAFFQSFKQSRKGAITAAVQFGTLLKSSTICLRRLNRAIWLRAVTRLGEVPHSQRGATQHVLCALWQRAREVCVHRLCV